MTVAVPRSGQEPLRQRLLTALHGGGSLLATPLLPGDFLGLVNPLWGDRELRARVERVVPEASGAVTLVLWPGRGWRGHRAGQWVRVGVEVDGVLHRRSYSLTAPPRPDQTVSITVSPQRDGLVSRVLVRSRPGDLLRIDQAAGEFVLPAEPARPLLMVTGGSGITPVMGMLRELASRGGLPDLVLVHAARTADDVIFREEMRALAAAHPRFRLVEHHSTTSGRLTAAALCALVPDWRERETWACGPAGLLDAVEEHWAASGVPHLLHTERFRPKVTASSGTGGAGGAVVFSRSGTTVAADGATPLLDAGEAAGVLLPSGCRMGICFSCVVPLRAGQVRDLRTGTVHGEEGDLVQTCVSAAAGPCELDA
jgi:ferredoxin-NADP reductase